MIIDLGVGLLTGLAYGAVGLLLLALGYRVVDALTPGSLNDLVYRQRNGNVALVVVSGVIALGTIVTTAIATSEDDFGAGIAEAAGYGLLGILLLAVAFIVVDRLTPGELGVVITDPEPHPAAWVTAATQLAVGAIVAASIA